MTSPNVRRGGWLAIVQAVMWAAFQASSPADAATRSKKLVFGAIAYEPTRGAAGYAYDFRSSREARIEALKQCGHPTCEVVVSFRNACGAVARGARKPVATTGATRAEAETKAMRLCGSKACEIVAWACTK
jgi:serine/threonine-protein kinase